jgi:hypothetical protein
VRVKIPGGGDGYIEKHLERSPSDTHAIFMKIRGSAGKSHFTVGLIIEVGSAA